MSISLLGKTNFNMDKLLHRGKYAVDEPEAKKVRQPGGVLEKFGLTRDLSKKDKCTYAACLGWTFFWIGVFIAGTVYHLTIKNISDQGWLKIWYCWIILSLMSGAIVTVWLTVGGISDLKEMLRRLRSLKRDEHDDGTVAEHKTKIEKKAEVGAGK